MNFTLIKEFMTLLEQFESDNNAYPPTIEGFKLWVSGGNKVDYESVLDEPYWEGKENGRTAESAL